MAASANQLNHEEDIMLKKITKGIAFALIASLAIGTMAACGGEKKGGSDKITAYTALPNEEIPSYVDEFKKESGITVEYVRLSAGEMTVRVKGEKAHPNAILMWGGSSDNYVAAMKDDLLEPYQSPELKHIPEQYHDPDKTWNPFYIGAIGFACNTEWFKKNNMPLPDSWEALLDPRLKGQIMMAHPSTSGTAYTVLATILQLKGEEAGWKYMQELNKNIRQYTKSGAAPANSAGLGECAVGIVFSHDGLKPRTEGYPIEVTFPKEGTGYEIGAMALIKNGPADQKEAAKKFIDWQLSKKGQEAFIANKSNRLPLNTEAKVTEGLKTINEIKCIKYDAEWAGKTKDENLKKFAELVADASNVKK